MRSKVPTLLASLIAILALAAAWHEYALAKTLTSKLAEADHQTAQLNRQLVDAKAAQDRSAKLLAQLARLSEASRPSPSPTPSRKVQMIHIADIIKDHPEYATLHDKDVRRQIIRQYGASLLALNLPADQLAKAKNLLVERAMSMTDAVEVAQANGLAQGSPEWRAAIEQAMSGVTQELNSLLQSDANTSLSEFELVSSTRVSTGNNLVPDFIDAGLPLTDAQAQVVAQASADASFRSPNAQHAPDYNTPDPTTGITPKQNQMINQVAPVLTPAQLDIYKTALFEMMQREALENQYRGNGPSVIVP
jgi:hypothetical protein